MEVRTSYLLYPIILISHFCFGGNDKYRIVLLDDPASTITIGWNQYSGTDATVHYGPVDFGTDYSSYPTSQSADRTQEYRGMTNHFVRLSGLTANTAYYFVIHDSEGTSDRFWFKTAPDDQSTLSFIMGGDSRNNRAARNNANLLVAKLKPHAVYFGGDMIDDDVDIEWQEWLDDWQNTITSDGRMIPIVPTRGNHESPLSVHHLFDTPTETTIDATDYLLSEYYAITWGDNLLRTYTLNSEIAKGDGSDQQDWLLADLENHTADVKWKLAQYHKPMRPHTINKSEGNSEYNAWAQLFFDYGFRLVSDSDSHTSKSSWPIAPSDGMGSEEGFIRNEATGTVYVGEGCWGAPLRFADDNKQWTRNSESFNQFKLVFVGAQKMVLRTILTDNAEEVGEVNNSDPFTLPAELDILDPTYGAVFEVPLWGEGSPMFTSGIESRIDENVAEGTVVYTAQATDEGVVNYSLGGIDAAEFNIDVHTGIVTINESPDYETQSSYSIEIAATDDAIIPNRSTQRITVKVNNLDESGPVFTSTLTGHVDEHVAAGTWVYTAITTDYGEVTYSLSGVDADSFTIDSETGEVTINTSPDYEVQSEYLINVEATDDAVVPNSTVQAIAIKVNDLDETGPLSLEQPLKQLITIYPNPTTGILQISNTENVTSISLHNLSGLQIREFPRQSIVDLNAYPMGIYLLSIDVEGEKSLWFRVIKQ